MQLLNNVYRKLAFNLSVGNMWKVSRINLTISMLFCLVLFSIVLINSCSSSKNMHAASDGPSELQQPKLQPLGNAASGKEVFRFETFGNEGFWFNAMRMQQGMDEAKVTPKQMLAMGLHFDMEALDAGLRKTLEAEFKTDLSMQNAPHLNDPKTTVMLINSYAVIGIVPKDSNKDKKINIMEGDMVGVSCALCHTITDASAFNMPGGGSAGRRIDGPAPITLNIGKLLATAKNSRAYYANLQLTIGGKTIGRAPKGLEPTSTEAEVDAYLTNTAFYPIGTFDETQDGIGNPVKNVPLFRQDLAAPFGTSGQNALLENISNSSYTANLDMTTLATPEGRQFMFLRAGDAGVKIHENYKQILQETGVTGYPFVQAKLVGNAGNPDHAVGRRVDDQKLKDMTAYLFSLPAPAGANVNTEMAARGQALFRTNCTGCHNVDQSKPVDAKLLNLSSILPGYKPVAAGVRGDPKQSAILNSPGDFDDKMVVVDASDHGEPRGNALPLLLDLNRTNLLLHNGSVHSLEELLNPNRGKKSPHPFYFKNATQRAEVVEFLRGLDVNAKN